MAEEPLLLSRVRPTDLLFQGMLGWRARPLRTALSTLGVAIGVAAIVGILGITQSSQSNLLTQLDQLGTNMLTVTSSQSISGAGQEVELPSTATAMIRRVSGVIQAAPTSVLAGSVYRNQLIPTAQTGGIAIRACDASLLSALKGSVWRGRFLNAAGARYSVAVLGAQAAQALGITHVTPETRVLLDGHWFAVGGILNPMPLAPEIDSSALIGFPVARALLGYDGHPSRIYIRSTPDQVTAVADLLGPTANPAAPENVSVSRPSDLLVARLAVDQSRVELFLGLAGVVLVVAAVGIANVMALAVLERRGEIGLRRALGATKLHIAAQFLVESLLLAAGGGVIGIFGGILTTAAAAVLHGWATLVPANSLWGGLVVALIAGGVAGLYPAFRAARLAPTDALRTV